MKTVIIYNTSNSVYLRCVIVFGYFVNGIKYYPSLEDIIISTNKVPIHSIMDFRRNKIEDVLRDLHDFAQEYSLTIEVI